ncbi:MAG: hypothetical protein IT450_24010 [Phycisphaerales bacterium]|nr:hypothetical protein [Phycisphaerales bacterium]
MTATRFAASLLVLTYLASSTVVAQCEPEWLPAPVPLHPVECGHARAGVTWDPDGDGPAQPVFVVGGDFNSIDQQNFENVAAWDGAEWAALGGLDGVGSIVVFRGELIATEALVVGSAVFRGPARWTGSTWEPIGLVAAPANTVYGLTVVGDELWAYGSFDSIDGVPCGSVAAWNGTSWRAIGMGMDAAVYALADTPLGVVAGGWFTHADGVACNHVARWDGSAWRQMASGVGNGPVLTICNFNGNVLIGGAINTPARGIARWSGTEWVEFGGGADASVSSLDVVGGSLYASGTFSQIGGRSIHNIARWLGGTWTNVFPSGWSVTVNGVTSFQDDLIILTSSCDPGTVLHRDSQGLWQPLGAPMRLGGARVMAVFQNQLYLSGLLSESGVDEGYLHRLNGSHWESMGVDFPVSSMTEYRGELVIGTNPPQRWDGADWLPVGPRLSTVVQTVIEFDGDLVVGGALSRAGSHNVVGVARWNGAEWLPMPGLTTPTTVSASIVHDGELYIGGLISFAGSSPPDYPVARWNGATWERVGSEIRGVATAFSVFDGSLIAGGTFYVGQGSAPNIASWNGAVWEPLGSGTDGTVTGLTVFDGELIASGQFNFAGGVVARSIARWNGSIWSGFDEGINDFANSVAAFDGDLYLTGQFAPLSGVPSAYVARWGSRPVGDLDDDRAVGIQDLANLLASFGACPGDESYNAAAGGLAGDECVGLDDLAVLLQAFGETCP